VRVYPATDNGTATGKPVFLSRSAWADKKTQADPATLACQQLMNPAAGKQAMFRKEWLSFLDVRPATLNVYIMVDPANSKKKDSDNTAMAVIGVDATTTSSCSMATATRWACASAGRHARPAPQVGAQPGVQMVKVGYERYGMQADLEYFEEQMLLDKDPSNRELNWTATAPAKDDRVQRLQPDFKLKVLPGHGVRAPVPRSARATASRCSRPTAHAEMEPYETSNQKARARPGQGFRIFNPVARKDHEGNAYSLNKGFLEEYLTFPFSSKKDLIDAASRLYDMEPVPPIVIDQSARTRAPRRDGHPRPAA
jgi:hypothetical protein